MSQKLAHERDGKGQAADVTPVITITRTLVGRPSNQSQII
ncbi:class III lanthipeptide [Paenibacillus thiaminolyticus]